MKKESQSERLKLFREKMAFKNENLYDAIIDLCTKEAGEEKGHKIACEVTKLVLSHNLPLVVKKTFELVTNEPLTVKEIASILGTRTPTVNFNINYLEKLGLIYKISEPKKTNLWVLM